MGNSVLDTGFSGEDLMLKTRKPYTITKQRERWTEEEHNRFLEALKKHGRAWQRIEEHIGTKTAVQIRSHAQKFFSKLEREALNKGLSISKAHDIEVPPPRPKKKPSNPYPRKISMAASTSSQADSKNKCVSSPKCSKLVLNFENDPTIQPSGVFGKGCTETGSTQRNTKEMSEGNDSPEVLTLFEDAPCASISSASKKTTTRSLVLAPPNPGAFREFIPTMKEVSDQAQMDEVSTVAESKGKLKLDRADADNTNLEIGTLQGFKLENHFLNLHAEAAPLELNPIENPDLASKEMQIQSTAGYPRHVPVQVLDGNNMEICLPTQSPNLANSASMVPQLGIHGTPSTFINQTVSATSELHKNSAGSAACPPFSIFRPHFTQFHGNADTHKLPTPACALNISSTLSSLIISNLLQNPAAHAAASLAASCWPCTDMGNSADGGLLGYMNPSPSIAAVAAATVAAATAWWATHGPLPFCPPHPTSFAFAPTPSTTTIPLTETSPFPLSEDTEERKQKQPPGTEFSATLGPKHEASASQPLTSSGSEESLGIDQDGTKLETEGARQEMLLTCTGSDPEKPRKQVDRSSCGSNTSSSSEVETDAVLEKQGEWEKEASKEAEFIHPESELSNRRSRTVGNINDSWKEVSEEGRLAFRALFSRQVLPQSFSPPQDIRNKLHPNGAMEEKDKNPIKKDEDKAQLDLNDSAFPSTKKKDAHLSRSNADKGSVGHVKLKARQTGFEPYKRCSVEAKEATTRVVNGIAIQTEERSAKRIRLEGKVAM